ncbi:hypothetical protein KI387_023333, partial [Taxus chinensis]
VLRQHSMKKIEDDSIFLPPLGDRLNLSIIGEIRIEVSQWSRNFKVISGGRVFSNNVEVSHRKPTYALFLSFSFGNKSLISRNCQPLKSHLCLRRTAHALKYQHRREGCVDAKHQQWNIKEENRESLMYTLFTATK